MTLRTALVIDGNAEGAKAAADQAAAGLDNLESAAHGATAATSGLSAAARSEQAALAGATAATRSNTVALAAHNAMTRQAIAQRTNLIFQLNDVFVSLASGQSLGMVAIQQGSQISSIYGSMGKAMGEIGKLALGAVQRFGLVGLAIGAIGAGIAGLQYEINKAGNGVKVSFGDTALAIFQTLGGYVVNVLKPLIGELAPIFNDGWEGIKAGAAAAVNFLVRGWMKFIAEIELIAGSIEHIFDGAWVNIYNAGVDMLQKLLEIMWFNINNALKMMGQTPVKVDLSFAKLEVKDGWSKQLLDQFNDRTQAIDDTDYAAKLFGDIAANARKNALDSQDKKKGGAKESEYAREIAQIRERTAALQLESNVIGLSAFAAEKMRKTLELETAARKDSIGLSKDRVKEIETEATAYAKATASLEQQKAAFQAVQQIGESAFNQLTDAIVDGGKSIGDILGDLAKQFAKLALQMAIMNPLQNSIFGTNLPTAGGSGNFLTTLFSSIFGKGKAAGGNVYPGKIYPVGEKGPELFAPGMSGTIVPNHQLGGGGLNFTQNIRNESGARIATRNRRDGQGNLIQDMVISTVQKGMADDDFRANGIRGVTKSR